MLSSLESRVSVITGASQGIGKAIATEFASAGARVVATARNANALDELVTGLERLGADALAIPADVTVEADRQRIVEETLQRFGQLDVLVNNAGLIHQSADLVDFDAALWRWVIEVNLVSVALLSQVALRVMMPRGSGVVINIASIGGRQGGSGRSAYRASKAGVINLTESMAAEAHPHGIRVNCICPGAVATEGAKEVYGWDRAKDSRLMEPVEIARLAVFLASDVSSSIMGAAIDAFGASNPLLTRG